MCGIAGYHGSDIDPESGRSLLSRMVDAVAHRGPDDQGLLVNGDTGLGHRRLSIIDVAGGQQPMSDATGEIWITFNGEIFNYIELREELIACGHRFRTESDTEVILQLYQEIGTDFVERLNGDFAFALWDRRCRRLILARDRIGVRPLYFTRRRGTVYFASEVKALLEVPGISAELDPIALDQIFTLWSPIAPRTIFKDIEELRPGHILVAEAGRIRVQPYWRLEFQDEAAEPSFESRRQDDAVAEELEHLLVDATRIRLRSDVPVGSYLSGGLDSSLVSAIAARLTPDRLRTFSIQFEAEEFDESHHQAEMVAALGTEHDAAVCTAADIVRDFPDVIRHAEQPILRTAPTPLFALSRQVRDSGFKVVLTGEGADEVFAGYDLFKESKIRRFCARQPESRMRFALLRRLYPYLPAVQSQSQQYLDVFFGSGLDEVGDPLFSHLPRFRTTAGAKMFFSEELRRAVAGYDVLEEIRDSLPREFKRWHTLSQAQYLETRFLLPGYILSSQGDRVAMAHGVEGRFPFLDHRVVAFAAALPAGQRLKRLREKHILRESAKSLLPPSIRNRTKQPYRAPESQCFAASGRAEYVRDRLSPFEIRRAGYFNASSVEKLFAKSRRQGLRSFRDNAAFIGVLSTQIWHHQFVRGYAADRVAEPLVQPA
jgi:asparagine synthase (glutamine-hydrolysing)